MVWEIDWSIDLSILQKYDVRQIIVFANRTIIQSLLIKIYQNDFKTSKFLPFNIEDFIWIIYGTNSVNDLQSLTNYSENFFFIRNVLIENVNIDYIQRSISDDESQMYLPNLVEILLLFNYSTYSEFIKNRTCSQHTSNDSIVVDFINDINDKMREAGKIEIINFFNDSVQKIASFTNNQLHYESTFLERFYKKNNRNKKYNFHNRTLRICVLENNPYFKFDKEKRFVMENVSGFLTKIIAHLSKVLQFRPDIYQPEDGQYGVKRENQTIYTGCVGEVQTKKAFFAAGSFSFNEERNQVVDYTYPIMTDPQIVVFQKPSVKSRWWNLFLTFQTSVWLLALGAIIIVAVFTTIFCRFNPYSAWNLHLTFAIQDEVLLKEHLWTTIGSFLIQGQDFYAYPISSRLVTASWWIFSTIVFAVYSAQLTSILTINSGPKLPETLQDIAESDQINLYLTPGHSVTSNLKKSQDKIFKKLYAKSQFVPDCQNLLRSFDSTNVACVNDYSDMRYLRMMNCSRYGVVQEVIEATFTGFLLPKFSDYKGAFDKEIQVLAETGVIWKWFLIDLEMTDDTCENTSSEPKPMEFDSLRGIFIVTIITYLLGCCIMIS